MKMEINTFKQLVEECEKLLELKIKIHHTYAGEIAFSEDIRIYSIANEPYEAVINVDGIIGITVKSKKLKTIFYFVKATTMYKKEESENGNET